MPKETAMYQVLKNEYEGVLEQKITSEVIRNATKDEFSKFMNLHDVSVMDVGGNTSSQAYQMGAYASIKENFDVKNNNDVTLTKIEFDTSDGMHHTMFELSSKVNDWHTAVVYNEPSKEILDTIHIDYQFQYVEKQMMELTGMFDGNSEENLVSPVWRTDERFGDQKFIDLFESDLHPTALQILHEASPAEGYTTIG